jgi:AhpD family alkylhydroperoxidase
MKQRLAHTEVAPELFRALGGVNAVLTRSALDKKLIDLVFLRVSQINGCAYCVDMHGLDLRKLGESERRLNSVAVWWESPFFSEQERAVFAWAEGLVRIASGPVPDSLYAPLQRYFNDKQIVELTYAVALINAWNRIALGCGLQPEVADSAAWPREA